MAEDRDYNRARFPSPVAPSRAARSRSLTVYLVYTLVYLLGLCLYAPRALVRRGGIPALRARLGRVPETLRGQRGALWIHAVSVGEVQAARALIPALRRAFPDAPVVVSTTTPTGQEIARRSDADAAFYVPLDLPSAIAPYLTELTPRALLLVETEIWPNLLRACGRAHVPVLMVNGRLSERSFRRYRWLTRIWPGLLRSIDGVCARTEAEAARFRALGVAPGRVAMTGNLKGEAAVLRPPETLQAELRRAFGLAADDAPVLVAGCTMPGEEALVLDAFERARRQQPRLRLLLAPRHPERFDEAARLAAGRGHRVVRRSEGADSGGPGDVLLLDTIGELPAAYGLGCIAFVGGSLVPTGGHNLLEPAAQGQPVLFGPHMHNFSDLAAAFLEAEAGIQVADAGELTDQVARLLDDEEARRRIGARGIGMASRDAGAAERTVVRLRELLEGRS